MQRVWPALFVLIAMGCDSPSPTILNPNPKPGYMPCDHSGQCPSGQVCQQAICVPDAISVPDAGTPGTLPDAGSTNGPPDTDPNDPGPSVPDTTTQDPGVVPSDPGKPVDDECELPSNPCEAPKSICKIHPTNGGLVCTPTTFPGDYMAPCSNSGECDAHLGCHFSVCTPFCEVKFTNDPACDGQLCKNVGHPVWGSCQPPPQ